MNLIDIPQTQYVIENYTLKEIEEKRRDGKVREINIGEKRRKEKRNEEMIKMLC